MKLFKKSNKITTISNNLISSAAITGLATILSQPTLADDQNQKNNPITIPAIVVKKDKKTGKYDIPVEFPGSATYISPKDLEKQQTTDVNRAIRQVPGVNVTEEDGYGLRPNIGLRGGRSDRSADISLMEDGILIAPAPYAASSAYYFPSMGRIKAVEVRKGSSSIKYGPRTTSGAVNLLTTPIPSVARGQFTTSIGNYDEKNLNFNYGDSFKNFGYVVNFDHASSDGFKELDGGTANGHGDTGYELNDFLGKFRIKSDEDADIYQHLEFKLGLNDETSNETYLGLTHADFVNNPFRRYRASALDEMNSEHRQFQVSHYIEPSDTFNLTTTLYRNEFQRNWYKLDKVDDGTNGSTSISNLFNGNITGTNLDNYLNVIRGDAGISNDARLYVKANNRDYVSQGIQTNAQSKLKWGDVTHNLEYGARIHFDEEDRFQHSDQYSFVNGEFSLETAGTPGGSTSNNRIASARGISGFIEDEIVIGKFSVTPGLRFESLKTRRKAFSDPERTILDGIRKNSEDELIPGIATSYKINDESAIFAGVHKGFAPPGPSNNQADAEESINYELGYRFKDKVKFFETIAYFNDYSNLLGEDTNSGGGAGSGDQYNGGEVAAYGLEVAAGYDFTTRIMEKAVKFPTKLGYTFTDAKFRSSFEAAGLDEWGTVTKGDSLPYISRHQLSLTAGIEVDKINLYLFGKYLDKMSAKAGSNAKSDKIPSHFVLDFVGFYEFSRGKNIFVGVDNIFDRKYAVSLRPAGLRPGRPMTARIGLQIDF